MHRFEDGFHVTLNINGEDSKNYMLNVGDEDHGNKVLGQWMNFQVGSIMKLNANDLIRLNNLSTRGFSFYINDGYEFSLILKRLA